MKRDHLSECGGCGSEERLFLYNVRLRGSYRRLCTSCLLKSYAGSFCPICFQVYDESPPPHQRLMCLKCPSISHLSCVPFHLASRYECPPCANPNFLFLSSPNHKKLKANDGESHPSTTSSSSISIDKDSAKVLVAAARIATASMNKAAAVARVEAERRVKEAALAKKRAREALERVAYLVSRDKDLSKDSKGSVSVADQKIKSKVDSAVSVPKRIQNRFGVDGIDKPGVEEVVAGSPKNGISIEDNVQGERDSNGLYSVPPVSGQLQQQSSLGRED